MPIRDKVGGKIGQPRVPEWADDENEEIEGDIRPTREATLEKAFPPHEEEEVEVDTTPIVRKDDHLLLRRAEVVFVPTTEEEARRREGLGLEEEDEEEEEEEEGEELSVWRPVFVPKIREGLELELEEEEEDTALIVGKDDHLLIRRAEIVFVPTTEEEARRREGLGLEEEDEEEEEEEEEGEELPVWRPVFVPKIREGLELELEEEEEEDTALIVGKDDHLLIRRAEIVFVPTTEEEARRLEGLGLEEEDEEEEEEEGEELPVWRPVFVPKIWEGLELELEKEEEDTALIVRKDDHLLIRRAEIVFVPTIEEEARWREGLGLGEEDEDALAERRRQIKEKREALLAQKEEEEEGEEEEEEEMDGEELSVVRPMFVPKIRDGLGLEEGEEEEEEGEELSVWRPVFVPMIREGLELELEEEEEDTALIVRKDDHLLIRRAEIVFVPTIEEEERWREGLGLGEEDEDALAERRRQIKEKREALLAQKEEEEEEEVEEEEEEEEETDGEELSVVRPLFVPKIRDGLGLEEEDEEEEEEEGEELSVWRPMFVPKIREGLELELEEEEEDTALIFRKDDHLLIRRAEIVFVPTIEQEARRREGLGLEEADEDALADSRRPIKEKREALLAQKEKGEEEEEEADGEELFVVRPVFVPKIRDGLELELEEEEEGDEEEEQEEEDALAERRRRQIKEKNKKLEVAFYRELAMAKSGFVPKRKRCTTAEHGRLEAEEGPLEEAVKRRLRLKDKTILPKGMQVKKSGRSGRTKWTHLVNEDNTDWNNPWAYNDPLRAKYNEKMAAMNAPVTKPKGSSKLKTWEPR